jgi:poly-gamma-glutamate synthesis protein (capsule biosynthesis protein)
MRTAMVSGSTAAAFLVGGVIASIKSPVENSNALTSPVVSETERPSEVKAAAETVVVRKHDQVADPSDPNVTMLFSGDVTLSDNYERQYGHDPSYAFAKLDKYRQVDLAMVNLENPLTRSTLRQPGKRFAFKADPKMVDVLKQGGVDIVTLANNHTMDYQEPGLIETLEVLDDAGIMRVGAGRNLDEARRPKIVDVKGQRIAFLGYYGEEYAATATKAGVNTIDETRIAEDIRAIRDQVDWIIVNYHWGQELATHPAEWQRTLARFTIDQGADVIVGHHPHVLQGTELYKGRPIAYSLGNFIFGGNSRSNYDTAILKVAVNERQMKVDLLPIQVRQYQPQIAQGEAGASILKQVQQLSAGFEQPMQASMVLDVQPSTRPGNAARSPMVNPAQPAAPTPTPSTLPEPRVTEPAKPTSEDPTAVPETSPDGGFITAPNHTPFNKSNPDSWNLPKPKQPKWQLRLPFSQPKPEEAGETEPETTDASEADALLPGGLPQAEVSSPAEVTVAATSSSTVTLPVVAPGKIERRTSTTLRPSEASPLQSSASPGEAIESGVSFEPEISPQDWKQPGKVGAELVPDVSLQGAPQW